MAVATEPRPRAAGDEVHVSLIALEAEGGRLAELRSHLDAGERRRAERLLPDGAGRRFTVARGRLRELLGEALGIAPALVRVERGPGGKPRIGNGHGPDLRFSLSRSGELALVAIAVATDVGADIERLDRDRDPGPLARRAMSAAELRRWLELDEAGRRDALCAAWVRKEAYLKGTAEGLTVQPAAIEAAARAARGGGVVARGAATGWTVHDLPVGHGHRSAVAWRGERTLRLDGGFAGVGALAFG